MTRINLVPPSELHYKHLVTEYREIPRVFTLARRRSTLPPAPSEYTLGKGHVVFFYSKLGFLLRRQRLLIAEMLERGYNPTYSAEDLIVGIPTEWLNDWVPSEAEIAKSRQRLQEKMPS